MGVTAGGDSGPISAFGGRNSRGQGRAEDWKRPLQRIGVGHRWSGKHRFRGDPCRMAVGWPWGGRGHSGKSSSAWGQEEDGCIPDKPFR